MDPTVAQAFRDPGSEHLLRLLARLYSGDESEARLEGERAALDEAVSLGLVRSEAGRAALNADGFLAANVAKEYLHWVDGGRQMPPPRPALDFIAGMDVLDLGCSFGRWLWEFQKQARSVRGLERQDEYIALGRALALREGIAAPEIQRGCGEDLDLYFGPGSVDFLFCRLVLNHLPIRSTLRKIAQVLRPGGVAWLQVESARFALGQLAFGERRLRTRVRFAFGLLNSLVCATTGRQLTLRTAGRMEGAHRPAYPPLAWWKAAVASTGLRDVHVVQGSGESLVIWARKR
jgi:SAM-dependent methyltransferase